MKLNIDNKSYLILNKIDMKSLPHIGQYLRELWVLGAKENIYHIFIRENLNWCMCDVCSEVIKAGSNFITFLEETKQFNLWEDRVDGEKKEY